jgi:hypothetical protein
VSSAQRESSRVGKTYPLRIFHISDLHERGLGDTGPRRGRRVEEAGLPKNMKKINKKKPNGRECRAGCGTFGGQRDEYVRALEFFTESMGLVHGSMDRWFIAPENRDENRTVMNEKTPENWRIHVQQLTAFQRSGWTARRRTVFRGPGGGQTTILSCLDSGQGGLLVRTKNYGQTHGQGVSGFGK